MGRQQALSRLQRSLPGQHQVWALILQLLQGSPCQCCSSL